MQNQASPNGQTSVTLSSSLVTALNSLNVQALGFGGTAITNGVASFSITGGAVDLRATRLEVLHSGGLTFRAGGTEVSLTDFTISNLGAETVLTGVVIVNGNLVARAPLFSLTVGSVETGRRPGRSQLRVNDVSVNLTQAAADALNQAFNVSAFSADINIGTAQVDAFFNRGSGNIRERILPIQPADNSDSLFPGATQDVLPQGKTSVALSENLVNALDTLNVRASGFGSTRINDGVADFLITGGATDLDTTKVEIAHAGGLTLRAGRTRVSLTDFVITNLGDRTRLTGAVVVNNSLVNRLPLFNLQIGSLGTSSSEGATNLDIADVGVRLTRRAANALNQAFGVSAFQAGFEIGTAQVDAFVA